MSKATVFTMELEPDLQAQFMAAAEESQRPAAQEMRELMREFIESQRDRRQHRAFLHQKVEAARASVHKGQGRSNESVEAEFAARRTDVNDPA